MIIHIECFCWLFYTIFKNFAANLNAKYALKLEFLVFNLVTIEIIKKTTENFNYEFCAQKSKI